MIDAMNATRGKVLIMTDWFEPGYKAGGPIQSCKNIVDTLKEHFDFYILTSNRDLGDREGYPGIRPDVWITRNDGVKIMYTSPAYLTRQTFTGIIRAIDPGVVYFNSMFSLPFTLKPLWYLRKAQFKGKIVLAPRGMLHEGALKKKTRKKKIFLAFFKILGWHKRITFHATDGQEIKDIRSFFPEPATIIQAENIPNIDRHAWEERLKIPGRLNCIFISRIHPKKNLHFAVAAMKAVDGGCNLLFDVYGEEDDAFYSLDCKRKALVVGGNTRITFYGPLPHAEVFKTLKRYHLFVLPTLGENFGHSIYEALSAGVPVLVSDKTPWQNLSAVHAGRDLPLEHPSAFTQALETFCKMDQQEFNKWLQGAKDFADQFAGRIDYYSRYAALFI